MVSTLAIRRNARLFLVPGLTPIVGFAFAALHFGSVTVAQEVATQTTPAAEASDEIDVVKLPEFVLEEARVANELPASTFAAPVSALRFEPRVDVQARNFAEAQGDITIRGGIFEGTAMQVAGLTLLDPQTGHYTAELPIPPDMLGTPSVLTGFDHAFSGMHATVGTIRYGWSEIRDGGNVQAAFGNGDLRRGSIHAGRVVVPGDGREEMRVATEAEIASSRADGTIPNGDHDFFRAAGRVSIDSTAGHTNLFAGYQTKFFGWPNLYTPFGVAETEDLHTTLLMVSHRQEAGDLSWETAASYRRNHDDYEFDRFRPGLFNPYQHTTHVTAGSLRVSVPVGEWRIDGRAELSGDEIESTSLGAHDRTAWKLGAMASRQWGGGVDPARKGVWTSRFGVTYDDTNRDASAASPLFELAWDPVTSSAGVRPRWYVQYSESTRVPGYTALYSAPGAGLFRGSATLGREESHNLETGLQVRAGAWSVHAALFQRNDDPLVDWTFTASTRNARTARPVKIDNVGFEVVASHTWGAVDLVAGYTWLEKDADYLGAVVDASFYALNFPRHRFTLAVIARLGGGFELRSDNEYRVQEENLLRTVGGDSALLSSLGIFWRTPHFEGFELSLVADNLWQSEFQELPAVPAPGRQVTLGAGWRW